MRQGVKKPRRIGIDARFYGPVGKGLGRYQQEIVDNIIAMDTESEYVVFLGRENINELKTENPKVKKVLTPVRWYTLAEQILMPFYIWRERLDLIHFPHFNVPLLNFTRFVVTIHDLILIRFPTMRATTLGPVLYRVKHWSYRLVIKSALLRAAGILAVSEYTKRDIVRLFGVPEDRITVTYEGVAPLTYQLVLPINGAVDDDKNTLLGYNIYRPFFLYVGNAYPHKNLNGLIEVFIKIREGMSAAEQDMQLVLVGKDDYFYTQVKEYARQLQLMSGSGAEHNVVVFPGYVPDTGLKTLYQHAVAYVFPSFYEGFGLPPLEAMANGCPVVCSGVTSMPEILGDAALYFDPNSKTEIQQRITEIMSDGELRKTLIRRGYEKVKEYSWVECAKKTLKVYRRAMKLID